MIVEPLAVTGLGIVSPIGIGREDFLAALLAGEHGIRRIDRFPVDRYRSHLAGSLPADWIREQAEASNGLLDACASIAIAAAREAWNDARLRAVAPERVGIVLGSSAGGFGSRSVFELGSDLDDARRHAAYERSGYHVQTAAVAEALGIGGPRVTVSTACTSSIHALASASLLLDGGDADVVLVGGADALSEAVFAGFHAMGAMSASPCAPFSTPLGMTIGEGAGFLVVEREAFARERAASVRCVVNGFSSSCDAHHATAPDPTGTALARAFEGALADAGIDASEIGWISAHGTGTEPNDAAEWNALQLLLGDRASKVPVSATKSFLGHALGAAGVLELAAVILALERQVIPATLHHVGPRMAGGMDVVDGRRPRVHPHRHVLKSSAAFGGINAAVVVSRAATRREAPPYDDVVVLGTSAFAGADPGSLLELDRVAGEITDVRSFDCLGRHLTALARRALDAAHVHIRGALRDRSGLVIGAPTMAWDTLEEFWETIKKRGFERASLPAFSRAVMNAPAGAVSRAFGLRGHGTVLACGALSGSLAAIEATRTLGRGRRELDLLLVGSAYEMGPADRWGRARRHVTGEPVPLPRESGAVVVLARRQWALASGLPVRAQIAATAAAGPGDLGTAIARVLGAERRRPELLFVVGDGTLGSQTRIGDAIDRGGLRAVPRVDLGGAVGFGDSNDLAALVMAVERLEADPDLAEALVVADAEGVGGAVLAVTRPARVDV